MTDPRSWWLSLDAWTPRAPLPADRRADVALVGGGFTALWTAYLLLRANPGLAVVLLESDAIGHGASGRNGGFAMTLVHRTLSHLAAYVGDGEARKVYEAARRAVAGIEETVRSEAIACDPQPNGLLTLSDAPAQDRIVEAELETATRLGVGKDFTFLDRDAARARLHSERIRCGLFEETCLLLNPARLARGLAAVVERLGGVIHERTPVLDFEEGPGGVAVRTSRGTVRADRVLVAGNAYGTAWKPIRDTLLPFYSYICLTPPLSDAQWARVGWAGREGAEDRRVSLHYFRPTADGRILWGGRDPAFHPDGPRPRYDRDERIFRRMRESFEWFFPQLRDVPFEHGWGGPIAVTGSFLPAVGWLDPKTRRTACAYGYNGHGVAISRVAAHAVADWFADRESDWTDLCFVGRLPRGLGPRFLRDPLVRWTVRAQIRADDAGRAADPWMLRLLNRLGGADLRVG